MNQPRHHGFTCPNCGSHYFGTYTYIDRMGTKFPHGTRVGECHAHHHAPSTCRFEWDRGDSSVESQVMYEQTEEEWAEAMDKLREEFRSLTNQLQPSKENVS